MNKRKDRNIFFEIMIRGAILLWGCSVLPGSLSETASAAQTEGTSVEELIARELSESSEWENLTEYAVGEGREGGTASLAADSRSGGAASEYEEPEKDWMGINDPTAYLLETYGLNGAAPEDVIIDEDEPDPDDSTLYGEAARLSGKTVQGEMAVPGAGGSGEDGSFGKGDPDEPEDQSADQFTATTVPAADFAVKKTADVSRAHPGDTVTYRISITNTGNVTLHSVVSTEKFVGAGVLAYFREQEGIRLNESRTQALIARLLPGETALLTAYVVIPAQAGAQQLVNQVEITSQETGSRIISSEAVIPLVTETDSSFGGGSSARDHSSSSLGGRAATPKTGDDTPLLFWISLILLAASAILSLLFFIRKA